MSKAATRRQLERERRKDLSPVARTRKRPPAASPPPPSVVVEAVYIGGRKLALEEWRDLGDGRFQLLADRRGQPVTFHARGET